MTDTQEFLQRFTLPLTPKWGLAPEYARCRACGAGGLERSFIALGGPWAGSVRCKTCGFSESVMSHVGRTCFKIETLVPE